TRVQYVDLKTYLPDDIITKVDRATMAVGLEARPPLLDHKLIETVFRVPALIRVKNGQQKHLLRSVMQGTLPDAILQREKKGFSSPLIAWLRDEQSWAEQRIAASGRLIQKD